MAHPTRSFYARFFLAALVVLAAGCGAAAQDAAWRVSKSSGEVWLTTSGAQPASLTDETILRAGDNIRTGRNGRALLVRGEETMLISPNSVIGIPAEPKNGPTTTILQQAGSVLIEAEKRNVKHFEVETPYLAAVVKGTQFRVSVDKYGAHVDVHRGQVEVADFKSGQHALVLPGQTAKVSTLGPGGLSLRGSGKLNPIERGEPRRPSVNAVPVPANGLGAPPSAPDGQTIRALQDRDGSAQAAGADGVLRIKAPLGEMNVNFHKVTNGLAREASSPAGDRGHAKPTVWSSGALTPGNGVGKLYGTGNGNVVGNGNAGGNSSAAGNGNAYGQGNGNGVGNVVGIANNGNGNGVGNGVAGNSGGNGGNVGGAVVGNTPGNGNGNGIPNGRGHRP